MVVATSDTSLGEQFEPNPPHVTYLALSLFLILYALFSRFIRNRLHLSEPPLAVVFGIIFGPFVLDILSPRKWGLGDNVVQETTRLIVGIQCFAIGIELPKFYFSGHWRSVLMMLGPVMAFGWLICTLFVHLVFKTPLPASFVIAACLTPTDPVLAASVLAQSRFSNRVPSRIKHLLSAESATNDGVSFPFLYVGLSILTTSSRSSAAKKFFLITILWQCVFGILLGLLLGHAAYRLLRFSERRQFIGRPSFLVFYLLLAILAVSMGAILGSDDFLIAFGAGIGFASDGFYATRTQHVDLPNIIDLLLNSSMFVYFGTIIPWREYNRRISDTVSITPGRLIGFVILVLLFRRIPFVLALKRLIPHIRTYREALFCGHFGPMGLGGLFLAIEARAQLETGTSLPVPFPPSIPDAKDEKAIAAQAIWPIVSFVVFMSTIVHGLSVLGVSLGSHFSRKPSERAPLLGGEEEGLEGMIHTDDDSMEDDEESSSGPEG
ncbi:MAG: hypothetical protein Q9227_009491 [Pyrenula ochraceoflavens]